jgi:hypothetical protein
LSDSISSSSMATSVTRPSSRSVVQPSRTRAMYVSSASE